MHNSLKDISFKRLLLSIEISIYIYSIYINRESFHCTKFEYFACKTSKLPISTALPARRLIC